MGWGYYIEMGKVTVNAASTVNKIIMKLFTHPDLK